MKATSKPLNRKMIFPQKLKILVLSGNEITNDYLNFLPTCTCLIKLDLSLNNLSSLPEVRCLPSLRMLLLKSNNFSKRDSLSIVWCSPILCYLDYRNNPLHSDSTLEHQIVNEVPSLHCVNGRIVSVEERTASLLSAKDPLYVDPSLIDEWKTPEVTQPYYLRVLAFQLRYIDYLWCNHNPVVRIQRVWRSIKPKPMDPASPRRHAQLLYREILQQNPLRAVFMQWKTQVRAVRNIRRTLHYTPIILPLEELRHAKKVSKVKEPLDKLVNHVKHTIERRRMTEIICSCLFKRRNMFQSRESFYNIAQIQKEGGFYFARSQLYLIENFLQVINIRTSKEQNEVSLQVSKQYDAIRLVDSYTFSSHQQYNSFCTMLWPSMRAVVVNRRRGVCSPKVTIIGIKPLYYIRNRDKKLSKEDRLKSNQVYTRLTKFAGNEYEQSLLFLQCRDETLMRNLLRMIYYHNTGAVRVAARKRSAMLSLLENDEDACVVYVGAVLRRTAAAVCIQKTWRRIMSRRQLPSSIYQQMRRTRAAMRIQQFIRSRRYAHRMYFHKKILHQMLPMVQSTTLYLPADIYMHLPSLTAHTLLYTEVRLTRDPDTFSLGVSEEYHKPMAHALVREKVLKHNAIGLTTYSQTIDVYNLLHCRAQVSTLQVANHSFLTFSYETAREMCTVAYTLALLSYQFWGSHYFLPLVKETIDILPERMEEYGRLRLWPKTTAVVLTQRKYQLHAPFIGHLSDRLPPYPQVVTAVSFYQKKFQNHPQKYQGTVVCAWQSLQSVPQQKVLPYVIPQRRISMCEIQAQFGTSLNVRIGDIPNRVVQAKCMTIQREVEVRRWRDEMVRRREERDQTQSVQLRQLREKTRQQKLFRETMRCMNEQERTEGLQRQVGRVRRFKSQKKQEKTDDFIQQSNFVMEQQLKMVIMKNRMTSTRVNEAKRDKSINKNYSLKHQNIGLNASMHAARDKRNRHLSKESKCQNKDSSVDQIQYTQPIRERRVKRKVMGAYIRDGTLVHGVFPEEYYPIANKTLAPIFPIL